MPLACCLLYRNFRWSEIASCVKDYTMSISGVFYFSLDRPAPFPRRVAVAKRMLDIFCATLGLVILAPLMLIVAIAVKLTSRGPAFFRQVRVRHSHGAGEQLFTLIKYRTMRQDAETKSGPVWATERDPRITRLGNILRKTRIDELPQLFQVLSGSMSLVGPRPERPHFTRELRSEIPAYDDRVAVLKPGITGWAQVRCAYDSSVETVKNKLIYDVAYAAHLYDLRTYLKMELRIILLTVWVMIAGKGAH